MEGRARFPHRSDGKSSLAIKWRPAENSGRKTVGQQIYQQQWLVLDPDQAKPLPTLQKPKGVSEAPARSPNCSRSLTMVRVLENLAR